MLSWLILKGPIKQGIRQDAQQPGHPSHGAWDYFETRALCNGLIGKTREVVG